MARHIRNTGLESRTARLKLRPDRIHRCSLGGKLSLSYRKGSGGGRWGLRIYLGNERYTTEALGEADDLADANGSSVLSFTQAQDKARERMKALDEEARIKSLGPVVTVSDAVKDYLAGRQTALDASGKLNHVLADEAISKTPLATLTADDLIRWRERLSGRIAEASVRRVCNDFRASLNGAGKRLRGKLPPGFRDAVKDGLAARGDVGAVSEREPQVLSDADVRRIVDAAHEIDNEKGWGGDLYRMTLVLAATGARMSQVCRLRVADVQIADKRIMVPVSRKGRGAKKTSHIGVPVGDDVIDAIKPVMAGRKGTDLLLLRPRWRRAPAPGIMGGVLEIYARSSWRSASELTLPWRYIVERAGLPKGLIPYCLRHSAIVRGLKLGLPARLVAALADTSSTMIDRHYGLYIVDALNALARTAVVPLVPTPVAPLRVVES